MRHREQLLIVWPRDGQKKCRFINRFDLVLDRSAKGQQDPSLQVVYLSLRRVTDGSILDRLVHNAYRIEMNGESMRKNKEPQAKPIGGRS